MGKGLDICCRRMLVMSYIVSSSNLSTCKVTLQPEFMIQNGNISNPTLPSTFYFLFFFLNFLTGGLLKPVETTLRVLFGWKAVIIYSPSFKMACS